jgi:hypothetical protein
VSILTKSQTKAYGPKVYQEGGQKYRITATVRYDDQCGNGHNSFAITADIRRAEGGYWREDSGGCCHDEVAKHFPQLAPLLKWHGMTSEGPTHYIANTVYHASNRDCNGLLAGEVRQLRNGRTGELCWRSVVRNGAGEEVHGTQYADGNKPPQDLAVSWEPWNREGEGKERNFEAARSCAVWPEATDAELSVDPEALKAALLARAPALCEAFRRDVEALGMVF